MPNQNPSPTPASAASSPSAAASPTSFNRDSRDYWNRRAATFTHTATCDYELWLMRLLALDPADTLLDMGCGTSILAILARMRGAKPCTAIDIDEWCVRNSIENIELNGVTDIAVSQGDASALQGKGPFDVVIANINRNILLNDMKQYVACMHPGSELFMSGFYIDDIPAIRREAEKHGLTFVHHQEKNRWAAVKFVL